MSQVYDPVRGWLASIAVAAVVAVGLIAVEPSPELRRLRRAPGRRGVTVVVDYGSLGGGVQVACALGDPATGLAALQGAGLTVTGTQRWGLAFVCRINGKPTAATEPCINTPPAGAYWSYWHASGSGAAWTYSTLGATSYNPAPGTVEGWSFGAGAAPSITAP